MQNFYFDMNRRAENVEQLSNYARNVLEIPLFGVADTAKCWFHPTMERFRALYGFAIVIGLPLCYGIMESLVDGPNELYLSHYRQINYLLDKHATTLAQGIEYSGWRAVPIPASVVVDWQNNLGHFSHRHAAVESGLAWWGRNNLAVTSEFGSHQRWVTILTNAPLTAGCARENGCIGCALCRDACMAGAIGNSALEFKRELCISMLRSFSKRGIGHSICGMCIKVCKGKLK